MNGSKKVRFGIFHKVLLTMVLVAVAPLTAVWYMNYVNTADNVARNIGIQFQQGLGYLTHHVDSWVDMNRRMLRQNANLPDVLSMDEARQTPLMKLITEEYDWNYLAFTVAPDGQNIARSDGKKPKFYGDRVYVKQVLDGKPLGKQVLIGKTSGKPALVMSVPIANQNEPLRGVLAIAMTIAELSERITTTRIGNTGFAFLVDETGKVIAHPSSEMTSSRQDLSANRAVAEGLNGDSGDLVYTDIDGRKVIAHMQRTADKWLVVMQQDYDEAFAALQESNRNAVVMLALTVVLVILIAYLFSRRLSVPILQMTEAADAVSRGKVDAPIEGMERGDELGLLAAAINRLRNSTRIALQRLKGTAKKRTTGGENQLKTGVS